MKWTEETDRVPLGSSPHMAPAPPRPPARALDALSLLPGWGESWVGGVGSQAEAAGSVVSGRELGAAFLMLAVGDPRDPGWRGAFSPHTRVPLCILWSETTLTVTPSSSVAQRMPPAPPRTLEQAVRVGQGQVQEVRHLGGRGAQVVRASPWLLRPQGLTPAPGTAVPHTPHPHPETSRLPVYNSL